MPSSLILAACVPRSGLGLLAVTAPGHAGHFGARGTTAGCVGAFSVPLAPPKPCCCPLSSRRLSPSVCVTPVQPCWTPSNPSLQVGWLPLSLLGVAHESLTSGSTMLLLASGFSRFSGKLVSDIIVIGVPGILELLMHAVDFI